MAVLKDVNIDSTLRQDMVDVDFLLLSVSTTTSNGLDYSRIVLILALRQQWGHKNNMIGDNQVPFGG